MKDISSESNGFCGTVVGVLKVLEAAGVRIAITMLQGRRGMWESKVMKELTD